MTRRNVFSSIAAGTAVAGAAFGNSPTSHSWFIDADDRTSLFYRDWGTGKPVLFVHSWGVNSDLWQYQMWHVINHGCRAIAFDRRGHGQSSDPGHGYNYDQLADDLAVVIVVRYLSRHGSARVSRIALVAPTLPFGLKTADNPDGVDSHILETIRRAFVTDFPGWVAANVRPFFVPETSQAMLESGMRLFDRTTLQAIVECNRIVMETDFRAELPDIKVPTLVMHGNHDASAPLERTGRKTAALIPNSRLVVYEGAPHGLMYTHMDRFNADLVSFIQS
jgi:non-heme chloroperoxidase